MQKASRPCALLNESLGSTTCQTACRNSCIDILEQEWTSAGRPLTVVAVVLLAESELPKVVPLPLLTPDRRSAVDAMAVSPIYPAVYQ